MFPSVSLTTIRTLSEAFEAPLFTNLAAKSPSIVANSPTLWSPSLLQLTLTSVAVTSAMVKPRSEISYVL